MPADKLRKGITGCLCHPCPNRPTASGRQQACQVTIVPPNPPRRLGTHIFAFSTSSQGVDAMEVEVAAPKHSAALSDIDNKTEACLQIDGISHDF